MTWQKNYLAETNLSALLQGNSSNHEKLKEHEEICNNHDSCRIGIPKCVEKILKYNPGENH